MKHIVTAAAMLNLGVAAIYAQRPINMTFSGTGGAGVINLQQPGTGNVEENEAGSGTLGQFSLRIISAETTTPESSSTCSGPSNLFFVRVSGAGVLRFQDGSLLRLSLTQGTDCIDLAAQQAQCTITFQIIGGTGRFKSVSGSLTYTETVVPVLADAFGNPVSLVEPSMFFFADTGQITGTVSGVATEEEPQNVRQ
jgi:hypothetical protein